MSRKYFFVISILIVLALFATACQTGEETTAGTGYGDIVKRIQDRGNVVCGNRTDLAGFGELDANGRNVGFDIDLCRAIAAALLDDPDAVEFVPLSAAERGYQNASVRTSMLSRTRASAGESAGEEGSSNAVCAVNRAHPSSES